MKVTRTSILSGATRTIDIPLLTQNMLDVYAAGALAQDAFKGLSDDDREFLMTGITAEEWDSAFGDDDE
jgi:hypothetical protein